MGSLVIQAVADAQLQDSLPDTNKGTGSGMVVGFSSDKGDITRRGLFRFLLGDLPNQATVDLAVLRLRYSNDGDGAAGTVNYVTTFFENWVENEVTWNSYKTGSAWTAAGGDFDETDRGEFNFSTVHPPDNFTSIDVTALVERAVAAGRDELDVIVKRQAEIFATANQIYFTREIAEQDHQPRLTVSYTLAPTFHDREAEVRMLIPVSAGDVLRVRGAQVRGVQELQAKPDGSSLALSLNH